MSKSGWKLRSVPFSRLHKCSGTGFKCQGEETAWRPMQQTTQRVACTAEALLQSLGYTSTLDYSPHNE
jgi:hypothetical protein